MKLYTEKHEWVEVEGDIAILGISAFAAKELGDITYVELPEEEDEVEANESFATVESVKAASDVYSPISGTVIAINEELEDAPETVNADAEGDGWLCKVEGFSEEDLVGLMTEEEYLVFIAK
jgi:glycine cleavage system H protein